MEIGFLIVCIVWLGAAVGLAFIPAAMAKKKGYSYGGFWAFGFFLFVPAIIVAAVIEDKTQPRYQPPYPPYGQPPYQQPGQPYGQPPYAQMINCSGCGAPVKGNDAFCINCGARIR